MARSLDGLVLAPLADQAPGQVGTRTRFTYHERQGEIWAEYAGGDVVRGRLVGTTSSGHCVSAVVELPDGRVRLEETWEWESRQGSGTSVVEQVTAHEH
jgi:hypothetical protein